MCTTVAIVVPRVIRQDVTRIELCFRAFLLYMFGIGWLDLGWLLTCSQALLQFPLTRPQHLAVNIKTIK